MGDALPNLTGVAGNGRIDLPVTTAAAPVAGAAAKAAAWQRAVHQAPLLAPLDVLQKTLGMAKAKPAALFADTAATQASARQEGDYEDLTLAELQALGARSDKTAFFKALLPGAIASEKAFGVPASVILAQAALESGWAKHAIGGFNLFGIKGEGPAGKRLAWTREVIHGKSVRVQRYFAQFHSIAEAVSEHGKVFHNGSYDNALAGFQQKPDAGVFVDAIAKTYATTPKYAPLIKGMLKSYGLVALAQSQGGH